MVILFVFSFIGSNYYAYKKGYGSCDTEWVLKNNEVKEKYENIIFNLNESYTQTTMRNNLKYESLQHEFNKTSDNLAKCSFTSHQLFLLKQAANMQVPSNSISNDGPSSRELAYSEGEPVTCADSTATMFEWANIYFETKAKLDYFQGLYNGTQANE